jgi:hypothetical protein
MAQGIHHKGDNGKYKKDICIGETKLSGFSKTEQQAENACYQPDNFNDITNFRIHY